MSRNFLVVDPEDDIEVLKGLASPVRVKILKLLHDIGLVGLFAFVWRRRRRSAAAIDHTAMTSPSSHYASSVAAFRPDDAPHYDIVSVDEPHYARSGAEFRPQDVPHYDKL